MDTVKDGTITDKDSNDFLTDKLGFGFEKRLVFDFSFFFFLPRLGGLQGGNADYRTKLKNRRALNLEVLDGRISFRDSFRQMLESIKVPFEECKEELMKSEFLLLLFFLDVFHFVKRLMN